MSGGGDDPFGRRGGDRTVIVPNPGGRRPQPPPGGAPVTPQPSPQSPFSPANAPAYGAPLPRPVEPARTDDWIASVQQPSTPSSTLPRAEDLRFSELAADNENPVMRAAGPLLLLLGRLRVAMVRASFASLMEQVALAINFFEKDIRTAGMDPQQVNIAKYILCATADDIVQNIPTDDRHVWTQYSMLSRFFGERTGGVRFFEELERLQQDPVRNYDLLELQHACLALGFQGVHRSSPNGASQLQTIQRNLYELLRRVKPKVARDLSPRWQGQALALKTSRIRVPVWSVAAIAALALAGGFIALRTLLASRAEAAASDIVGLHPTTPVVLERRLPSLPLAIEPTPTQLTQLQRIRTGLAPEIQAGTISVDSLGRFIDVRVGNLILFDSGKADLLPAFGQVALRISEILENETGPIRIVGHTDNQPLTPLNRFKDNQQLSIERAKAVAAALRPGLSQPSRLALDGRGPDEPIADNKTAEGRAKNRRVDILISRTD